MLHFPFHTKETRLSHFKKHNLLIDCNIHSKDLGNKKYSLPDYIFIYLIH